MFKVSNPPHNIWGWDHKFLNIFSRSNHPAYNYQAGQDDLSGTINESRNRLHFTRVQKLPTLNCFSHPSRSTANKSGEKNNLSHAGSSVYVPFRNPPSPHWIHTSYKGVREKDVGTQNGEVTRDKQNDLFQYTQSLQLHPKHSTLSRQFWR